MMSTRQKTNIRIGGNDSLRADAKIVVRSIVAANAVCLLLVTIVLQHAAAGETERVVIVPSRAGTTVTLRDRLVVGLQARLKTEAAFVELVTAKVRTGQLPQRLVDETFFWARQKARWGKSGRPRRPIIFFEPAMRARAKRIKVDL
jgi:hypothetical protein